MYCLRCVGLSLSLDNPSRDGKNIKYCSGVLKRSLASYAWDSLGFGVAIKTIYFSFLCLIEIAKNLAA